LAEEFIIKSQDIEDKINQLLPSQGGFQAGVDFSASTMVIPIVDLTETAEGSALRQDLQRSISHNQATVFDINGSTSTVINTTGYYLMNAGVIIKTRAAGSENVTIQLNDGTTDKTVYGFVAPSGADNIYLSEDIELMFFLPAGNSLKIGTSSNAYIRGSVRQIASLAGDLTNPS
jgi:hypothetical protein